MSEELKKLIEKVKQEGIQAGQERAIVIEAEAQAKADALLEKTKAEASEIISQAKIKVARMQESSEDSLKQAARDTLLALRKEINSVLDKLITIRVNQSLSPEATAKIIATLIKNYSRKEKADIRVLLKKKELGRLKKSLIKDLSEKLKQGVTLKGSEDIRSGFLISYDGGKSQLDFTDKAISAYIGSYLKPQLALILQGQAPAEKKQQK